MNATRAPREVRLEPLVASHAEVLAKAARQVAADPATAKRLWWAKVDYALEDAQAFIAAVAAERNASHGYAFAVFDDVGELLGVVSAKNVDWMHGCFQGGYWLKPAARGKGFGQAALKALFDWAKSEGLARMELLIGVDNAPSLAVARRIGAVHEGIMRSRFVLNDTRIDVAVMAMLATERSAQPAN